MQKCKFYSADFNVGTEIKNIKNRKFTLKLLIAGPWHSSMQSWPRYISPPIWRMLQIAAGSPLLPAHITSANLTLLLLTEKRVFKLCSKGRLLCLTNSLRYPPHNSHNASSCHIIWNAKDRITFNYKHILFSIIRRNIFTPKIIIYRDWCSCRDVDVRCNTCSMLMFRI